MSDPQGPAPLARSQTLADQALENLVNQFARPLDFLRELVQNSIDAGSPRVEVWLAWSDPEPGSDAGVLEIHVDDSGEGMDEALIDTQLTRMFSSTKEDDLTKIGKFGIGFTSIFAIQPDAVLLRTGRHGESWELLFHPDRSFDKVRLTEPVVGTRITMFKRMPARDREAFVRECRWVLGHWCEHSNTPVTFWDRTAAPVVEATAEADPFAAFAPGAAPGADAGPERMSGPMRLDAPLQVRHSVDGIDVAVGYADEPRYGFYNGGLTLLSTRNRDALGSHADRLGHLTFKLKSNQLEHTLTRDNVLQDAHWAAAMAALEAGAEALRAALLERLAATPLDDAARLDPLLGWLAAECRASGLHKARKGFGSELSLPTLGSAGSASLDEIEHQEDEVGAVLLAPPSTGLCDALAQEGLHLLPDRPAVRAVLDATWRPPRLRLRARDRQVVRADVLFVQPELVEAEALSPAERVLVERAADWVSRATGGRVALRVGAFGGPEAGASEDLALEGPRDGGLFQRPRETWFRLPAFLRRRCLLVNRHHPAFRAQVVAAAEDPVLAAFALTQAILHVEGIESEDTFRDLLAVATDLMVEGAP